MEVGKQSVITTGVTRRPLLSVDSWNSQLQVDLALCNYTLLYSSCDQQYYDNNISGAIAYQNSYFGDHLHPSDNYFSCIGDEFSLSSCMNFTYSTCNFANTAGVYCRGDVILGI